MSLDIGNTSGPANLRSGREPDWSSPPSPRKGCPRPKQHAPTACPRPGSADFMAGYRVEGEAAFEPRSRRPKAASPRALPVEVRDLILRLRKKLGDAGLDAGTRHHRLAPRAPPRAWSPPARPSADTWLARDWWSSRGDDRARQPSCQLGFSSRHVRWNGSRQAFGAISSWIPFGPQLPGAYGVTGGGAASS